MTEDDILKMVEKKLMEQDINDKSGINKAIEKSIVEMELKTLESITRSSLAEDKRAILEGAILARAKLGYFYAFQKMTPKDTSIEMDVSKGSKLKAYAEDLLFIYQKWLETFTFLYYNYNDLVSASFKEKWPREVVENFMDDILLRLGEHEELIANGRVLFNPPIFLTINKTLCAACGAILGDDIFIQFSDQVNKGLKIIKEYRDKVILSKNDGAQ